MILLLVSASEAAEPTTLSLGFGAAASIDLPAVEGLPETAFGPGASVVVPFRWSIKPGASLRVHLEVGAAAGHDRVVWVQEVDGETVGVFSEDHEAGYAAARLLVGPEVALFPRKGVSPYLGVGAGPALVTNWHRFDAASAALQTSTASTLQATGAAGADVGLRLGRPDGVAVEIEVGYTVSFLPAASLQQAPPDLEASRSPYALDVVRGGLGVSIPL